MVLSAKKVVIVGDVDCGKRSLKTRFTHNMFEEDHSSGAHENSVVSIEVDEKSHDLALWTISGQENHNNLRPQTIYLNDTDVILLCYSIANRQSLQNISEKWYPEVKHHCKDVPVIVVGNKNDLRAPVVGDAEATFVSYEDGKEVAVDLGAYGYVECSAITAEGVQEVFQIAARAACRKKKCNCSLL